MSTTRLTGVSLTKVIITLLPWLSVCISFSYLVSHYHAINSRLPNYTFSILLSLIFLNSINIIRGALNEKGVITTIFGNSYTSLALLTPLAFAFGVNKANLKILNKFFVRSISIGTPIFVLLFAFSKGKEGSNYLVVSSILIYPVTFLICTISYQSFITKCNIIFSNLLMFYYYGFVWGSRTTLIYISLLYLSSMMVYFYEKYKMQWIPSTAMCTFLLPFFLLTLSIYSGQSVFQMGFHSLQSMNRNDNITNKVINKADTRTFLYIEVFEDLEKNSELLFGKGSSGTYYSPYFNETGGDRDQRFTVEVGILALLLKGGIIAVILNLAAFYIAIHLAFFRANNQYIMGIGFILLIHTLILFIENTPNYTLHDISIWFFVGVCLSKELRMMSNREIQLLLYSDTRKSSRRSSETPDVSARL